MLFGLPGAFLWTYMHLFAGQPMPFLKRKNHNSDNNSCHFKTFTPADTFFGLAGAFSWDYMSLDARVACKARTLRHEKTKDNRKMKEI